MHHGALLYHVAEMLAEKDEMEVREREEERVGGLVYLLEEVV